MVTLCAKLGQCQAPSKIETLGKTLFFFECTVGNWLHNSTLHTFVPFTLLSADQEIILALLGRVESRVELRTAIGGSKQ